MKNRNISKTHLQHLKRVLEVYGDDWAREQIRILLLIRSPRARGSGRHDGARAKSPAIAVREVERW